MIRVETFARYIVQSIVMTASMKKGKHFLLYENVFGSIKFTRPALEMLQHLDIIEQTVLWQEQ